MEICNTIDNLKRFVCLGLTEKISQIHENNEIQNKQQYDSKYHPPTKTFPDSYKVQKITNSLDSNQNYLTDKHQIFSRERKEQNFLDQKISSYSISNLSVKSVGRGILG